MVINQLPATSDSITEKVFTIREPSYTKRSSKSIRKAENEINNFLDRNDIETTADPNNNDKLLILFIHGFAASKYCWLDPDIGNLGWIKDYRDDPRPKDYGWHVIPPPLFFPVDWTLSEQLIPTGITEYMDSHNYEWLTYSQKSAFGDIEVSVNELIQIMNAIAEIYGERRIVIVAHSRGGLISKRFLDISGNFQVKKLITLGTPFGGTFMSAFDTFRHPSKMFLNKVKTARRLWDIQKERRIESIATKQMAPNSQFIKELNKRQLRKNIHYVNVAGTSSHITNVYTWHWAYSSIRRQVKEAKKMNQKREALIKNNQPPKDWFHLPSNPWIHCHHWILKPRRVLTVYPKIGYNEILQGDGAVSVKSALLPNKEAKHYVVDNNHLEITCSNIIKKILLHEIQLSKKNES